MSNEISVERVDIDGLDITFVTQPDTERLRANVILPFETTALQDRSIPSQIPHLLEHVVCCGDGSVPAGEFKEQTESLGGSSNASTASSINGVLAFETTQPDDGTQLVQQMIRATFHPAVTERDFEEQRTIVRNELRGYLQSPERQRESLRLFRQGLTYSTDPEGLETLGAISLDDVLRFQAGAFAVNNARFVLTGQPDAVSKLAESLRSEAVGDLPIGARVFAPSGDIREVPDYHASALEIPDGMTQYAYCLVSEEAFDSSHSLPELRVAMSAFYTYLIGGRNGMIEQSRNQGLSYGVNVGWSLNHRQASLSVSDTTSTGHVDQQIDLLHQSLERFDAYGADDFERFRRQSIGAKKLYPDDLLDFARVVEGQVAATDTIEAEIVMPQEYRAALQDISLPKVLEIIQSIKERMERPAFTVRHAFGDNPFGNL